jgi:hypothetical protein
MIAPHRFVVTALILLSTVLTDCDPPSEPPGPPTPEWCHADLGSLVPQGWTMISPPTALDTDGDDQTECAVFYRLDANPDTSKITTVGGVVYRRDHGGPPRFVYPCLLQLPVGSYLGEHTVSAKSRQALSGAEGLELVVEDKDLEGNIVQATVFGWNDPQKDDHDAPPDPKVMYYKLLGLFRGEGGVEVRQDSVIVTDTITGTRSRLAYHRVYTPTANNTTYYSNNTSKLVGPKETEVVALIECKDPKAVCFPEKTVLDFYRNVTGDIAAFEGLMMPDVLSQLKANGPVSGCKVGRDQLNRVLVQNVTVGGTDEKPVITVKVQCRLLNGKSTEAQVIWTLEKYDGKWRLKSSK